MFLFKTRILVTNSFLFLGQDASEVQAGFIFYSIVHNSYCLRSYLQAHLGE